MLSIARTAFIAPLAALAAATLTTACGGDGPGWAGTVDTTASGVVIVENPADGLWEPGEAWTLTEELRIGSAMSEGPDLFARVRGLVVDSVGRIHVLDRQATELRTFGPDGQHIRTVGREGGGPGEFRDPIGMTLGPDGNLWVVDPGNTRYSVFTPEGEYVTSHRREQGGYSIPWRGGFGPDGRFYEQTYAEGGMLVLAMDSTLAPLDSMFFPEYDEPRFTLTTEQSRMSAGVPFATSQSEQWVAGGAMWTAITGDYRLTRIAPDGDTLRVVHGPPMDPIPVTDEELEQAVEGLQWFTRQGGEVRASEIPSEKTPISTFHVADDHLWVRLTNAADQEGYRYHVLDSDGVFLGTVETTHGLGSSPLFMGDDIYTVIADSLGVQYVVRYGVRRGGTDLEG